MPAKTPEFYAHPTAVLDDGCRIGAGTRIWHFCHISAGAEIGESCSLGQNVFVADDVRLGRNVKVQNNVSLYTGVECADDVFIGPSAVFTNVLNPRAAVVRRHEYQPTKLGRGVSIGANATIDCATMGSTIIREGSKIDNLVQIAHNVEIGRHTVVASQSGISGSTKIGNYCVLAGQVGIVGHITLADRTTVTAQSGVGKSVKEEGTFLQGAPAFNLRDSLRANAVFRHLPELERRLLKLERAQQKPDAPEKS